VQAPNELEPPRIGRKETTDTPFPDSALRRLRPFPSSFDRGVLDPSRAWGRCPASRPRRRLSWRRRVTLHLPGGEHRRPTPDDTNATRDRLRKPPLPWPERVEAPRASVPLDTELPRTHPAWRRISVALMDNKIQAEPRKTSPAGLLRVLGDCTKNRSIRQLEKKR
jgi:hypothetical protein